MSAEEKFVNTFVVRNKRVRYLEFLAKPKKRVKILDRLNHSFDYDERLGSEVPSSGDHVALLRSNGAPEGCHVLADSHRLDGQDVPLEDAIDERLRTCLDT